MGCGASSNSIIARHHSPEAILPQTTTEPLCGLDLPTSDTTQTSECDARPTVTGESAQVTGRGNAGSFSSDPQCTVVGEDGTITGGLGRNDSHEQKESKTCTQPGGPLQHHQSSPESEARQGLVLLSGNASGTDIGTNQHDQELVGLPRPKEKAPLGDHEALGPRLNMPIARDDSAQKSSAPVSSHSPSPQDERNPAPSLQDTGNRSDALKQQLEVGSTVQSDSLVSATSSQWCDQLSSGTGHRVELQAHTGYSLSLNYAIQKLQFQLGFIAQVTVDPF